MKRKTSKQIVTSILAIVIYIIMMLFAGLVFKLIPGEVFTVDGSPLTVIFIVFILIMMTSPCYSLAKWLLKNFSFIVNNQKKEKR